MKKHSQKKLDISIQTIRALDLAPTKISGGVPSLHALYSCAGGRSCSYSIFNCE